MNQKSGAKGMSVPLVITFQRDVINSNTTVFNRPCHIYTGSGGTISLVLDGDDTVCNYANVQAGVWWPVFAVKVMETGTGATGIKRGW